MSNRTIIHSLKVPITKETEDQLWDEWVVKFDGNAYDYLGAIYLAAMIIRERVFKIKRPKVNAWATSNSFFCDQIYQLVSGLPGIKVISEQCNSMDSPHDVWMKLQ